jgi:Flp pilus assembly protein TadG
MLRKPSRARRGAALVEMAIVVPVLLFLALSLVIGGMGIFRYQEMASLAREAARYASVRGTDYAKEVSGATAATPDDVYQNAIKPKLASLDPNLLTYSVTWNKTNSPATMASDYEAPVGNSVTVTVTYKWFPELYLIGPITLSSSSTVPMSY